MIKKVGTVTFHRAQNYGSILQTYALQRVVCELGKNLGLDIDYKVIDIMPKAQKNLYSIYKKGFNTTNVIKNLVAFFYYRKLTLKQKKFADFLQSNINLTNFCQNQESLEEIGAEMDYCISGSDQIWNVRSQDFETFYYLDFVKNAKKISYSASFGPLQIDWSKYNADKYRELLNAYDYISTREVGSQKNVEILTGKKAEIHVDPTLLLSKEQWQQIQSDANYRNGKYILLYCLEPTKQQLEIVKKISKKLHLPVVVTKYNNKNDIFNNFVKKYDAGPQDFLALIDNAALVITSSFHGTAFSLIYQKNFYVLNGRTDNRISDILDKVGLIERSIESIDEIKNVNLKNIDFSCVEKFLKEEQQRSKDYLNTALDL